MEKTQSLKRQTAVRDIFLVITPIVVMGTAGYRVGIGTLVGGALVNLGYLIAIIVGVILLRQEGVSWPAIGLRKPDNIWKTLLLGILAWLGAVLIFVMVQNIAASVIIALDLAPSAIDESRFNALRDNLPLFLLMITLAWTTIAFGEEFVYRAFIISRLVDQVRMKSRLAILVSAVLFGVIHFTEGPIGILSNGAFGAFFAWIYLCSNRNLWIIWLAHGLLNTLRFSLLYAGIV